MCVEGGIIGGGGIVERGLIDSGIIEGGIIEGMHNMRGGIIEGRKKGDKRRGTVKYSGRRERIEREKEIIEEGVRWGNEGEIKDGGIL